MTLKTAFYVSQNQLTKIQFTWAMDELTSSYLKLEYEQHPQQTFDDLMNNIEENHLFSQFTLNTSDQPIPIALTAEKSSAILNFDHNKGMLTFWATLAKPIAISGQEFELVTYEKTFYVDMYYEQDQDATINNNSCQIMLDKPTPDDATLSYAQALDTDDTPAESDDFILGKLFAQKVVISCQ
ncbi:DUF1007 family protein [Orbus hercynius]|nr:DUF1007 family protein [Orbus hercynius]